MLSLSSGTKLAVFLDDKKKPTNKYIHYKDVERDAEPEINTSMEKKKAIFLKYLHNTNKLSKKEINELANYYDTNIDTIDDSRKLERYLNMGRDYVKNSLKRYLDFEKETYIFPIIEPNYRLAIFGLSGSGKSYFASTFLKYNKPINNGMILLFSPVNDDTSIKQKNVVHIHLETFEEEFEKPFELEDIPPYSVCIFDDCDTYNKSYRGLYTELRNTLLERGRHLNISTIIVQHQAQAGARNRSDIVLRECQYYCIFPKYNVRDSQNLLKNYTSITNDKIKEIMNLNSRWCFIKKSVPSYYIGEHEIGLI